MEAKPHRPTGVSIIGIFSILIGFLAIVGAIIALSGIIGIGRGIFDFSIGIAYLAMGIGFFKGSGWTWILGIIVTIFSIVYDLISTAIGVYDGGIAFVIFRITVALLIVLYLTRPHVKAFFLLL